MRAVRFAGPHRLELVDKPDVTPGRSEVRIRPLAVGLCGTDARIVEGAYFASPGVTLGHEIAGRVDAVGTGATDVHEGDLVTVEPHVYCGHCRPCRLGFEHLCADKRAFGVHLDGGMAEALVVPARLAYALPGETDPVIGCLAEPLACAIHGMDRLQPIAGVPLLVLGGGPAGLMLAALSRLVGTDVVVVEPDANRRGAAVAIADARVLDPGQPDWRERALEITAGNGFDFAIEAAGSPEGLETAVALSAKRGRILVYGVARPDDVAKLAPYEIYAKELTILGTALNPFTHLRAVELLPLLRLEILAPARFPLDAYRAAFDAQRQRTYTKVVIAPQEAG